MTKKEHIEAIIKANNTIYYSKKPINRNTCKGCCHENTCRNLLITTEQGKAIGCITEDREYFIFKHSISKLFKKL
jgi:hypothetical protein